MPVCTGGFWGAGDTGREGTGAGTDWGGVEGRNVVWKADKEAQGDLGAKKHQPQQFGTGAFVMTQWRTADSLECAKWRCTKPNGIVGCTVLVHAYMFWWEN